MIYFICWEIFFWIIRLSFFSLLFGVIDKINDILLILLFELLFSFVIVELIV